MNDQPISISVVMPAYNEEMSIVDAVKQRNADVAEHLTREEDTQAGREVMRLLAFEPIK